MLTGAGDETLGLRGLRAGAAGFLSKDMELESLPRALRGALEGEAAISRRLAMSSSSTTAAPRTRAGLRPVRSKLTDREWEVLDLLSGGASTEDIAPLLVLSTETVRSHLKNLYRKLEVRTREDAVEAAAKLRELGAAVEPPSSDRRRAPAARSGRGCPARASCSSRETCALTVATLMYSSAAISAFDLPWPIATATSRSRSVSRSSSSRARVAARGRARRRRRARSAGG